MAAMARYAVELKPRWSDMDAYGHVNNVTWLEYLQEARVDMFFVHAPQRGTERLVEGVVVARAEIDYKLALRYRPEPVRIEMWVSRVGAASFTVEYEVLDQHADGSRHRAGAGGRRTAATGQRVGAVRARGAARRGVGRRFSGTRFRSLGRRLARRGC
jgi:YbgC/YbaW family acyl-CoA thioester hydrolase